MAHPTVLCGGEKQKQIKKEAVTVAVAVVVVVVVLEIDSNHMGINAGLVLVISNAALPAP